MPRWDEAITIFRGAQAITSAFRGATELAGGGGGAPALGEVVGENTSTPSSPWQSAKSFAGSYGITETTTVTGLALWAPDDGGTDVRRRLVIIDMARTEYLAMTDWFAGPTPTTKWVGQPLLEPFVWNTGTDVKLGFEVDEDDPIYDSDRVYFGRDNDPDFAGVLTAPTVTENNNLSGSAGPGSSLLTNPSVTTSTNPNRPVMAIYA